MNRALQVAATLVVLSMLATALHDVSQAWDSTYYHLPFAARLGGILRPEVFVFHPANEARFAGFPLLGERLQGLLWRVTGRAESANLVAFGSVPLVAWFLRKRFAVPLHLTVLALFAVPLIHTHATSAYVDLPANSALAVLVLLAIDSFASPEPVSSGTLALAVLSAAMAANMKALLHPIVAVAFVALAFRALRGNKGRALALACALPIIFATPLVNLAAHGNPYYPIRMSVLGRALPGIEGAYSSSPPWLANAPRPFRFACSLLEIGLRPMTDEHRWTVDQWMPSDSMGPRMGGFFGAYVIVNVGLLAWRVLRDRTQGARAAGIGFAALTAVISVMPQSHELRYYLSWMIVLVALNLWLACRPETVVPVRGPAFGVIAALAFAIVASVTRFAYVLPLGSTFETIAVAKTDANALAGVKEGERVCVRLEPRNMLWAAPFHPEVGRRYVVVEAEEPGDCAGARPIE